MATVARSKVDPKFVILWIVAGAIVLWLQTTFANHSHSSFADPPPSQVPVVTNGGSMTQAQMVRRGVTAPFQLVAMVQDTIRPTLRDPDSAKYLGVGVYTSAKEAGKVHFCGAVNAKNGLGGYNGYRRFMLVPGVKTWFQGTPGFAGTYRDLCRSSYLIESVPF